ncbi:hypothetical protein R3P38DRAFT_2838625 [Favolaschia claudopus]|uniref:Uncharacterized protein n=1 Tax=Favolaschia claudopus TaxID=2862362 RepID=A0AAW0E7R8_9AGAR
MDFLSKPLHSSRPPLESRALSSMQTNEETSSQTSSSRTGSLSTPGRLKRARSISPPIDGSTLVDDDETVIASSSKRPSRDLYTPVPPAMRTEGRAVNISQLVSVTSVKERHTGSSWSDYREASAETIQDLRIARFARDNTPAQANARSIATTASTDVQFALGIFPETTDARPGGFVGNAPAPSPAWQPPCAAPSHWLLQPSLENCYLDVVIKGAYAPSTRLFTDAVGAIRGLEKIKRNERGSVKVRFGRMICTDKWVPVKHVFPLTTNEYGGVTPRALAKSILDVIGVRVVVIGADAKGRWDFVGKTGLISSCGKVDIDGASILFPITSLCRSDPDPK